MNELHLFAGAGGGILGGMLLGHRTVCAVEVNPYRRRVLLQRQRDEILPWFPIWDDIRTFDAIPWRGCVDVVCGGFPCQRFSTAHHGTPTALDLWPEMLRVIEDCQPGIVFAENVAADPIVGASGDLRRIGFRSSACKISASDLGADHIRERYWLLAHSDHKGKLHGRLNAEMAMCEGVSACVWKTFPDYSRVDDGVAYRVERLEATGNGQVPAVVKLAWETLSQ
jgi:DNA (cytosine-5)-methyltransferase 1